MPIRIKPTRDLGPCRLDLDSLKGICALVDKEFGRGKYFAEDGVWVIYDEPRGLFITNVSTREKLDTFRAEGGLDTGKKVQIVFNGEEAKVIFNVPPSDNDWIEHFMLDLNKHIRKPSLLQRFGGFPVPLVFVGVALVIPIPQPYCRILIKPKQTNPRLGGFLDNIAANAVYDLLKVLLGVILTLLAAWVLKRFGINVFKLLGLTDGS